MHDITHQHPIVCLTTGVLCATWTTSAAAVSSCERPEFSGIDVGEVGHRMNVTSTRRGTHVRTPQQALCVHVCK